MAETSHLLQGRPSWCRSARQTILKKPDTMMAAGLFKSQLDMIDAQTGVSYDRAQAEKLKMDIGTQYADSLLDGMLANKQFGAGNKFLNGEDRAGGEFLKYVDADKLGHFKARFKAGQDEQNLISKSIINKQLGDYKEALMSGAKVDSSVGASIRSSLASLPEAERSYINDDIATAERINQNLQTLKALPLSQAEALVAAKVVPQDDGTSFNLQSRNEAQSTYIKQAQAVIKQRRENPVQFYLENDKDIQSAALQAADIKNPQGMSNYVEMVRAKQQADGIPMKKILTEQAATNYKTMLTAKNAKLAVDAESSLRQGYGKHFDTMMADLAKDEKFQPYAVALSVNNPETKVEMLNKIHNEKQINEVFKQTGYKESDVKKAFEDSTYQQFLGASASADPTSGNAWVRNGIGKLIDLSVKESIASGTEPKEARKMAIKKIITDNYDVVQARNSSVIIPKKFRAADSVDNFIISSNQTSTYKALNVLTPKNYGDTLPDAATTDLDQRYLQDLAKNGTWVSNETQDGMYLTKKRNDGTLEKVMNNEGKMIEVKFNQMAQVEMSAEDIAKREDRQAWREKDQQMKDYINNKTKRNF